MIDNDDDAQNELHNQEQNILDQKQENFIDYAGVQDQQQKLLPDASDSEYFSLYFGAKARNYSDFQPNQQLALNAYYQMFTEWCKNPESFHQKEDYYSFNSLLLYLKNAKAAMNINFLDSLMTQNNVTSERLYDQFYQIINQNLIEAELFSTLKGNISLRLLMPPGIDQRVEAPFSPSSRKQMFSNFYQKIIVYTNDLLKNQDLYAFFVDAKNQRKKVETIANDYIDLFRRLYLPNKEQFANSLFMMGDSKQNPGVRGWYWEPRATYIKLFKFGSFYDIFAGVFQQLAPLYNLRNNRSTTRVAQDMQKYFNMNTLTLLNFSILYRLLFYFNNLCYILQLEINKTIDQTMLKLSKTELMIRNSATILEEKHINFLLKCLPNPKEIFGSDFNSYCVNYRNFHLFYNRNNKDFDRYRDALDNQATFNYSVYSKYYALDCIKNVVKALRHPNYFHSEFEQLKANLASFAQMISANPGQVQQVILKFAEFVKQNNLLQDNEEDGKMLQAFDIEYAVEKNFMRQFLIKELSFILQHHAQYAKQLETQKELLYLQTLNPYYLPTYCSTITTPENCYIDFEAYLIKKYDGFTSPKLSEKYMEHKQRNIEEMKKQILNLEPQDLKRYVRRVYYISLPRSEAELHTQSLLKLNQLKTAYESSKLQIAQNRLQQNVRLDAPNQSFGDIFYGQNNCQSYPLLAPLPQFGFNPSQEEKNRNYSEFFRRMNEWDFQQRLQNYTQAPAQIQNQASQDNGLLKMDVPMANGNIQFGGGYYNPFINPDNFQGRNLGLPQNFYEENKQRREQLTKKFIDLQQQSNFNFDFIHSKPLVLDPKGKIDLDLIAGEFKRLPPAEKEKLSKEQKFGMSSEDYIMKPTFQLESVANELAEINGHRAKTTDDFKFKAHKVNIDDFGKEIKKGEGEGAEEAVDPNKPIKLAYIHFLPKKKLTKKEKRELEEAERKKAFLKHIMIPPTGSPLRPGRIVRREQAAEPQQEDGSRSIVLPPEQKGEKSEWIYSVDQIIELYNKCYKHLTTEEKVSMSFNMTTLVRLSHDMIEYAETLKSAKIKIDELTPKMEDLKEKLKNKPPGPDKDTLQKELDKIVDELVPYGTNQRYIQILYDNNEKTVEKIKATMSRILVKYVKSGEDFGDGELPKINLIIENLKNEKNVSQEQFKANKEKIKLIAQEIFSVIPPLQSEEEKKNYQLQKSTIEKYIKKLIVLSNYDQSLNELDSILDKVRQEKESDNFHGKIAVFLFQKINGIINKIIPDFVCNTKGSISNQISDLLNKKFQKQYDIFNPVLKNGLSLKNDKLSPEEIEEINNELNNFENETGESAKDFKDLLKAKGTLLNRDDVNALKDLLKAQEKDAEAIKKEMKGLSDNIKGRKNVKCPDDINEVLNNMAAFDQIVQNMSLGNNNVLVQMLQELAKQIGDLSQNRLDLTKEDIYIQLQEQLGKSSLSVDDAQDLQLYLQNLIGFTKVRSEINDGDFNKLKTLLKEMQQFSCFGSIYQERNQQLVQLNEAVVKPLMNYLKRYCIDESEPQLQEVIDKIKEYCDLTRAQQHQDQKDIKDVLIEREKEITAAVEKAENLPEGDEGKNIDEEYLKGIIPKNDVEEKLNYLHNLVNFQLYDFDQQIMEINNSSPYEVSNDVTELFRRAILHYISLVDKITNALDKSEKKDVEKIFHNLMEVLYRGDMIPENLAMAEQCLTDNIVIASDTDQEHADFAKTLVQTNNNTLVDIIREPKSTALVVYQPSLQEDEDIDNMIEEGMKEIEKEDTENLKASQAYIQVENKYSDYLEQMQKAIDRINQVKNYYGNQYFEENIQESQRVNFEICNQIKNGLEQIVENIQNKINTQNTLKKLEKTKETIDKLDAQLENLKNNANEVKKNAEKGVEKTWNKLMGQRTYLEQFLDYMFKLREDLYKEILKFAQEFPQKIEDAAYLVELIKDMDPDFERLRQMFEATLNYILELQNKLTSARFDYSVNYSSALADYNNVKAKFQEKLDQVKEQNKTYNEKCEDDLQNSAKLLEKTKTAVQKLVSDIGSEQIQTQKHIDDTTQMWEEKINEFNKLIQTIENDAKIILRESWDASEYFNKEIKISGGKVVSFKNLLKMMHEDFRSADLLKDIQKTVQNIDTKVNLNHIWSIQNEITTINAHINKLEKINSKFRNYNLVRKLVADLKEEKNKLQQLYNKEKKICAKLEEFAKKLSSIISNYKTGEIIIDQLDQSLDVRVRKQFYGVKNFRNMEQKKENIVQQSKGLVQEAFNKIKGLITGLFQSTEEKQPVKNFKAEVEKIYEKIDLNEHLKFESNMKYRAEQDQKFFQKMQRKFEQQLADEAKEQNRLLERDLQERERKGREIQLRQSIQPSAAQNQIIQQSLKKSIRESLNRIEQAQNQMQPPVQQPLPPSNFVPMNNVQRVNQILEKNLEEISEPVNLNVFDPSKWKVQELNQAPSEYALPPSNVNIISNALLKNINNMGNPFVALPDKNIARQNIASQNVVQDVLSRNVNKIMSSNYFQPIQNVREMQNYPETDFEMNIDFDGMKQPIDMDLDVDERIQKRQLLHSGGDKQKDLFTQSEAHLRNRDQYRRNLIRQKQIENLNKRLQKFQPAQQEGMEVIKTPVKKVTFSPANQQNLTVQAPDREKLPPMNIIVNIEQQPTQLRQSRRMFNTNKAESAFRRQKRKFDVSVNREREVKVPKTQGRNNFIFERKAEKSQSSDEEAESRADRELADQKIKGYAEALETPPKIQRRAMDITSAKKKKFKQESIKKSLTKKVLMDDNLKKEVQSFAENQNIPLFENPIAEEESDEEEEVEEVETGAARQGIGPRRIKK